VRVYASTEDAQITEGETTVDGEPRDVYARRLDYMRWPEIFPEYGQVVVTAQHGVDARVTLIGTDGHRDNLHFHNQPAARMVWFEDTGNSHAEVWAEIVFAPADHAGATRVHTRLYADTRGLASIVVTNNELRRLRRDKIVDQLTQIRAYFRRRS
jgi:hypothetical protein